MSLKIKDRLTGLSIFIGGFACNVYLWYVVISKGVYFKPAPFFLPIMAFFGLSVFFYPNKNAEIDKEKSEKSKDLMKLPRGQKIIIGIGAALGVLQYSFFRL